MPSGQLVVQKFRRDLRRSNRKSGPKSTADSLHHEPAVRSQVVRYIQDQLHREVVESGTLQIMPLCLFVCCWWTPNQNPRRGRFEFIEYSPCAPRMPQSLVCKSMRSRWLVHLGILDSLAISEYQRSIINLITVAAGVIGICFHDVY